MKVAYVTPYNPHDVVRAWSGTGHFIGRALEQQGVEVAYIGPLRERLGLYYKARQAFYRFLLGQHHLREFEAGTQRDWARQIERKLARIRPDVILSPGCFVNAVRTDVPIVHYADTTFASIHGFYEFYDALSAASLRNCMRVQEDALHQAERLVFSSSWAARSAIDDYGMPAGKVSVIPFGANLAAPPSADDVERFIAARAFRPCRLLFIGVEWKRKGGDLALEVARRLNASGIETILNVVGVAPEVDGPLPDFVRPLGFISKATPEGRARLDALLAESHFLIVPSRAEAYGIVFCEASAFGVPALSRSVGGITEIIRDGRNGRTFPLDAGPEPYADFVADLMRDRAAYDRLAHASRAEYEARLSWDVAGAALREVLEQASRRAPKPQDLAPFASASAS
jgi:glycosyltransferase involved in cell wall biosynthesis